MTIVLTGTDLTLDEVVRVARAGEQVELSPGAVTRVRDARFQSSPIHRAKAGSAGNT